MAEQSLVTFESVEREELTAEENARVEALAAELDITDVACVRDYGADAQADIVRAARQTLGNTRIYQTDKETQELIAQFKGRLTKFKTLKGPSLSVFRGEFDWWQTKFQKVTAFIDTASAKFAAQINELKVDYNINSEALKANLKHQRNLLVLIRAGKLCLQKARGVTLPALQAKAGETGSMGDAQAANDFSVRCDEFELKLSRLVSSLAITYIRTPQINMLHGTQNTSINTLSELSTTAVALWLQEMQMALSLKHAEQANAMADSARELTEGLFMSNIERTGQAAEAAAQAAGKGAIRAEVIVQGTDKLIAALDKVAAAWTQAVESSRAYEHDLAENTRRIAEQQKASA